MMVPHHGDDWREAVSCAILRALEDGWAAPIVLVSSLDFPAGSTCVICQSDREARWSFAAGSHTR